MKALRPMSLWDGKQNQVFEESETYSNENLFLYRLELVTRGV